MNNIKSKKLLLIILIIILLITIFFNFFRFKKANSESFTAVDLEKEELFFKSKKDNSPEENSAVKRIALISEIKDPFQKTKNRDRKSNLIIKDNKDLLNNKSNKSKTNKNLLLLEESIFNNSQLDNSEKNKVKNKNNEKNKKDSDNKEKNKIKNIKLPFKIIGIIKNKNKAAVLFLYKGKNIMKNEGDKIDLFKISEINDKNITLNYKKQKRILKLWED